MNIVIVHFNTPELTEACIRSIRKKMGENQQIVVIENSTLRPLTYIPQGVEVVDNMKGQFCNFEEILSKYPDKTQKPHEWGSSKHCMTIDACMDLLPDGFCLLDADTLVKRELNELEDFSMAAVSDMEIEPPKRCNVPRLMPYCQWLNVPMLKEHDIRYFNGDWMWRLRPVLPNKWYDTGAWLLRAINEKELPWKRIDHHDYVEHLWHGSFKTDSYPGQEFLNRHKELWT